MMSLSVNNDSNNFYPVSIPTVDWRCDYLWSTHRGCPFDCIYCSSKRWYNRYHPTWNSAKIFKLNSETDASGLHLKRCVLPNASIFISPYNDIMTIPEHDVREIFRLVNYSNGWWFDRDIVGHKEKSQFSVILQTKNPTRYFDYLDLMPAKDTWLGTTIETDDMDLYSQLEISKAPSIPNRLHNMVKLKEENENFKYFITIEPIIKSYGSALYSRLLFWMKQLQPKLVFVGCGTGEIMYPEPSRDKLIELIDKLKLITTVHVKSNAQRILGDTDSQTWFKAIDMKG